MKNFQLFLFLVCIAAVIFLMDCGNSSAKDSHTSYECTPKEDNFVLFRVKDEHSLTNFDKGSKPLKVQPIHLNIKQFDGQLFDFFADSKEFSSSRARGWIAFGWGTDSFTHGIFYEIEPKYWNCEAEHDFR